MNHEDIARIAHEANRAYCQFLGDASQVPWDQAPHWQKESTRAGVEALAANPAMTPAQSHQNWMDLKVAQGWTHGYVKEPSLKKHPCIAPYDALPREQRAKYSIFRGVVLACLSVAAPGTLPTRHAVGAQQSLPLEP